MIFSIFSKPAWREQRGRMIKEMTRMRGCLPSSCSFSLCLLYIDNCMEEYAMYIIHTWNLQQRWRIICDDGQGVGIGEDGEKVYFRIVMSKPGILLQCYLSFLSHPQTNFSKECFATNGHEVKLLLTFPRMKVCRKLIRCGIRPCLRSRKNTLANEISAAMYTILHDMKLHTQIY